MNDTRVVLLVVAVVAVLAAIGIGYTKDGYAQSAVGELDAMLKKGEQLPEVSEEQIAGASIVAEPVKEHFDPALDEFYRKRFYQGLPTDHTQSSLWAPDLYTRARNWYPGYASTSHWRWYLRPGMAYRQFPRSRWVKRNQTYYYINNGRY